MLVPGSSWEYREKTKSCCPQNACCQKKQKTKTTTTKKKLTNLQTIMIEVDWKTFSYFFLISLI